MKVLWMLGLLGLCGCGAAATPCTTTATLFPAVATADHMAPALGNSVTFDVAYTSTNGCPVSALAYLPTLTSSDAINVALPSPGVATCVGTTTVPAVLTDTRSKATATLTCK